MRSSCLKACKLCTATAAADATEPIKWNFEAFLVRRSGAVHARWPTGTDLTAAEQRAAIEALLDEKDEL